MSFDTQMAKYNAQIAEWDKRAAAAKRYVVARIPANRTVDALTPEEWREASGVERWDFYQFWTTKGIVYFQCLTCGYPSRSVTCESCDPSLAAYYGRIRAQDRQKYTDRAGLL